MNTIETRLDRLFRAARATPAPDTDAPMPAHLRARVAAHWRATAEECATWALARVFRFALLAATVVMLATVAWSASDLSGVPDSDEAIATYSLRATAMP